MRKDEESKKCIKVAFRLLNGIELRAQNARWLNVLCRASHVLSILAYLVISSMGIMATLQTQTEVWNMIRLCLGVFTVVVTVGMVAIFAIQYNFFNEMGTLQQHKGILKVNAIVASGLYYSVEVVYFIGSFLFFKSIVLLPNLIPQDYILLIFGSTIFVVQSLLFLTRRLFGRAAILVGPMLVVLGAVIGIILTFLLAALLFYQEGSQGSSDHHLQRVLYFLVGITCLWSYLQIEYTVVQQNVVAFLNLIFIGMAAMGIYFFYPSIFGSRPELEDNMRLLRWFKERAAGEGQGEEGEVNLEEEELYEKHFQNVQNYRMLCFQQGVRDSTVISWKEAEKARILWQRIQCAHENDNCFDMNLFYFRAGFFLRTNAIALLKQLAAYLDKNRNLGLIRNYQLYKLNQEVFKYYEQSGSASDTALQIADVVQAEQNYHHFYQQLDQLLVQLLQFWKEVVSSHFSINADIQAKITVVSQLQRNAGKSLKKLSSYRIPQEQKLFRLVNELINCYKPVSDPINNTVKNEKIGSFQYVILQGEQIRKISLKLLKALGYEVSSLQIHSMKALLPVNFFGYLQEVQRRFLQRQQTHEFVVPIVQASGCIVLKQCLLYVVPHWSCALQYLLSFQSMEVPSQTFILYNANKQKIEHFSSGFRQFIGMKLDSFKQFAAGDNVLFSSDVFQTELGPNELQVLRSHEIIKTKVIYSDFYLRKNSLYNYNDEVTLHLEHQFAFFGQNYLLLNVQSQSFRQVKMEAEQKSQTQLKNFNKEKQLHQEYAHQEFFCKIENPYKSKIVQKLSSIRTRTYKSYFYQILSIKFGMLVLVLINAVIFSIVSRILMNNGLSMTNIMFNLNNEYIYLLRLFSGTYSNFLFNNSPNDTAQYLNTNFFNSSATNASLLSAAANLKSYYQLFNDKNSQTLMSTYLLYKPGVAQHMQMDYRLAFSEFNITTNTMLTSFYDFIVEVQQGFSDGSAVKFLAQNYDAVVSIMPVYQQYQAFVGDYVSQYKLLNVLGYVFIVLLTLSIIISFVSTTKMIDTHEQMHLLYHFIDRNDVKKIVKELTLIKNSIGRVAFDNEAHKSYTQLITHRDLIETNQQIAQSRRQLQNGESTGDVRMISGNIIAARQERTCIKAIYKAFKYIYFCPILFATAWFIIYLQYNNMSTDQTDYIQIINLLQKLQTDQMLIEKYYDDLFQPKLYQLNFGPYTQIKMQTVIKNQFYTTEIPPVFANDVFLDENLCQQQYITPITIPFFTKTVNECNAMELGIITKGYSQALEFYQTYLRDQARLNFSQYLSTNQTKNKMRQIIFLKQLLFSYLKIKKANFINNYQTYIAITQTEDFKILIFTVIACISLVLLLIYNVITLHRVMYVVIDLICAIPSSAMYKMNMTNYIRKEGILAKMDKL